MTRDQLPLDAGAERCGADCNAALGLIAQALEAVVPFYLAPLGPASASEVSLAREALAPFAAQASA